MVFDQGNASKCLDCKLFAGAPYLVHLVVSLFRDDVRNNNKKFLDLLSLPFANLIISIVASYYKCMVPPLVSFYLL